MFLLTLFFTLFLVAPISWAQEPGKQIGAQSVRVAAGARVRVLSAGHG